MNKFKNITEAEAFIKANGMERSEGNAMRLPSGLEVGNVFNATSTGTVFVAETKKSREAREKNPQLKKAVYIGYEYQSEEHGTFNRLQDSKAGQKFNCVVVESKNTDEKGNPYLDLKMSEVTVKEPERVEP
jgi:hypothetical protein